MQVPLSRYIESRVYHPRSAIPSTFALVLNMNMNFRYIANNSAKKGSSKMLFPVVQNMTQKWTLLLEHKIQLRRQPYFVNDLGYPIHSTIKLHFITVCSMDCNLHSFLC